MSVELLGATQRYLSLFSSTKSNLSVFTHVWAFPTLAKTSEFPKEDGRKEKHGIAKVTQHSNYNHQKHMLSLLEVVTTVFFVSLARISTPSRGMVRAPHRKSWLNKHDFFIVFLDALKNVCNESNVSQQGIKRYRNRLENLSLHECSLMAN